MRLSWARKDRRESAYGPVRAEGSRETEQQGPISHNQEPGEFSNTRAGAPGEEELLGMGTQVERGHSGVGGCLLQHHRPRTTNGSCLPGTWGVPKTPSSSAKTRTVPGKLD